MLIVWWEIYGILLFYHKFLVSESSSSEGECKYGEKRGDEILSDNSQVKSL